MKTLNGTKPRRHPRPGASALILVVAVVASLVAPLQAVATPFGPGSPEGAPKNHRIHEDFFGLDTSIGPQGPASWPAFDVGAVRVATAWESIERTPGVYDWANIDVKVDSVEQHGAKPLIVIQGAPGFHALGSGTPKYGSPPRLSAYRNFVRELVARYGERADYQVWNEGNVPLFFSGTSQQLAAMTKVMGKTVRELAPRTTAVAPSFLLRGKHAIFRKLFRAFWEQNLGKQKRPVGDFVDAASISAYPMPDEDPEDALALTQWGRQLVANHGFEGPLWAVEINYGASGGPPTLAPIPMEGQVAFVVRTFALHATIGADRLYWWNWEADKTTNTHLNDGTGGLTPAGTAFGVVQDWLLGTKPLGCTLTRGVTACGFRAIKGPDRYVYWTRSGKTRRIAVPEGAQKQMDPAGVTTPLQPGKRLKIGLTPIMVKVRSN